ncbi:MAG: HD domain-containing protein [Saccharofermentanales bacterium]|jgi:guanosine-3',5'-bis(diphosphate) 3'-pyrophosphohydrolase
MCQELDKRFRNMLNYMKSNQFIINPSLLKIAYKTAKECHKFQKRESGEPYLSHTLSVAEILAYRGFETNIIAAALLHDVVEDVEEITIQDICEKTNREVADIVEAVTKINKEELVGATKEEIDKISFNKFINLSSENKYGFYVKFADRIHNLRTIGGKKDPEKRIRKAEETRKYLLPIAKELNAHSFYNEIDNLCFKILDAINFQLIHDKYNEHIDLLGNPVKELEALLSDISIEKNPGSSYSFEHEIITERQLYNRLIKVTENIDHDFLKSIHACTVPIKHYFVLINSDEKDCIRAFYDLYMDYLYNNGYYWVAEEKFCGVDSIILEDSLENHYQFTLLKREDYLQFQNGTTDGVHINYIEDDDVYEAFSKKIIVFKKDGERLEIEEGATVLDFAFAIHDELGLCAQYAYLNKNTNRVDLSTKLCEGDRINIISNTVKGEYTNYTAEVRWFEFVTTKKAKKSLIKYFERKYNI